jgi:protein-disulfide isomerase
MTQSLGTPRSNVNQGVGPHAASPALTRFDEKRLSPTQWIRRSVAARSTGRDISGVISPRISRRSESNRYAVIALLLLGCRGEPSAQAIEQQLQQHPDMLYRVIERHPAEFIAALNRAAQVAQATTRENQERDASARMEAEFNAPKVPALDHRIAFGNPSAPITIVEYSDFECPYCLRERDVLVEVMKRYGDRVRLVVKQTPLEIHAHAMSAALTYEAVARQDPAKAFKLYDELFNHQRQLESQGDAYLDKAVRAVGADVARARSDARSAGIRAVVDADLAEFHRFGFNGTPGFLINGVSLEGSHPAETFGRIIDRHLAGLSGAPRAPVSLPARH